MVLRVQTEKSVYKLDVLSAVDRQVLICGGHWLKDWTLAKLKGTPDNRPLDDPAAIPVGYPMVLGWDDQTIITSPVVSVDGYN